MGVIGEALAKERRLWLSSLMSFQAPIPGGDPLVSPPGKALLDISQLAHPCPEECNVLDWFGSW